MFRKIIAFPVGIAAYIIGFFIGGLIGSLISGGIVPFLDRGAVPLTSAALAANILGYAVFSGIAQNGVNKPANKAFMFIMLLLAVLYGVLAFMSGQGQFIWYCIVSLILIIVLFNVEKKENKE